MNQFLAIVMGCAVFAAGGWNQALGGTAVPASAEAPGASTQTQAVPTGRLPRDVVPLAYTLDFTMNPDANGYRAHEVIDIRITKPLATIWLHGQGIKVTDATLALADGKTLKIAYKQEDDSGVAKFSLPHTVPAQKAQIVLDFTNPYSQGLMGVYKVEAGGDNYIFTQFEAIAARRAFVSFDEPGFKTPFTYSFTVPKSDKVVANTPVRSKSDAGSGMVKWQFMTTRPLPTYLVAWAVGPLDIVAGPPMPPNEVRDRAVPLYGVTVKGKGEEIRYALAHAGEIVAAEEKYYGIAYPWRKLSLIAVPDFGAGAMENAGAITFRDTLLLMDPKTAPTWQKRAYWSVAAHELAHMWTGDLVTVPWWNDIWLNEAFATWMAQKVMDELHPAWNSRLGAISSRQAAMRADSLASARAVRQPIKSTGDIKNAFDGITYLKGAAVISMFEHYVGAEKFREGMHDYLQQNAYGSGSLDDFLAAISKAAGENVGPAFKTFLNQPGLPMVAATLEMKNGKPVVHLVQSRYLPIGSTGNREGEHWDIPVCMSYAAGGRSQSQCYMLTSHSADVPLAAGAMPGWFLPNADGDGYFQWSLDKGGYAALAGALDRLSPADQMSFAGSIEAAFNAATIDTATTMRTLAALAHAKSYPVAEEPMDLVTFARERLTGAQAKAGAEAFARKLYGGYDVAADFARGGAPANDNRREFEASVADFLAFTGQDKAVRGAADAAADRVLGLDDHGKTDFAAVAPDFLPIALSVAVRDQGKPVFDALEKILRNTSDPLIRSVTLDAMASATEPALAQRARAMVFEPGLLRKNEILAVVFIQMGQEQTRDATWEWLTANYEKLLK
ncbi:MAG TPA: M1 family metallopeptidase, partial [Gammaproteobacteria bacterium]|nr:M1 family metallopeptidase [Gammaproteobacteria bacterium]